MSLARALAQAVLDVTVVLLCPVLNSFIHSVLHLLHKGHVPAEDPHHSSLLRLHAGEEVGHLPVGLPAVAHGWSRYGAGTS